MNEIEALEKSLLLWKELSEKPIIKQETKLFYLVQDYTGYCSLCEIYFSANGNCIGCCLNKPELCKSVTEKHGKIGHQLITDVPMQNYYYKLWNKNTKN